MVNHEKGDAQVGPPTPPNKEIVGDVCDDEQPEKHCLQWHQTGHSLSKSISPVSNNVFFFLSFWGKMFTLKFANLMEDWYVLVIKASFMIMYIYLPFHQLCTTIPIPNAWKLSAYLKSLTLWMEQLVFVLYVRNVNHGRIELAPMPLIKQQGHRMQVGACKA